MVATGTDDPDDPDLFRKAMSGVNRAHKNYQHPRVTAIRQPVDKLPIRTSSTPTGVPLEPPAIDDTGSGDTVLFVRPGLQRKNLKERCAREFGLGLAPRDWHSPGTLHVVLPGLGMAEIPAQDAFL